MSPASAAAPHVPVLIGAILARIAPVGGIWIDGTYGAGGYSRALRAAGADHVIGIDRDPEVLAAAEPAEGITLVPGRFGDLDRIAINAGANEVSGVVLDIGVSSMQIDAPERGFSFQKDGPLDMRMERAGPSAADLVNQLPEAEIADILFQYGEERASRRIARAIVAARREASFETTLALAEVIERQLPRPKPGQPRAATRSFQALRIAVNDELGELVRGLAAAERILAPGGILAVVTFHSLEDRIVKRFLRTRSGGAPAGSRHAPVAEGPAPTFDLVTRKAVEADAAEVAANPRARSAKLRIARRLDTPPAPPGAADLGLPARLAREMGR
ncbi:16S rRNA (cytosine(1402)-N(4))-methyltransferase RsmH [Amaricoccus solimangrovi]|uniref:Ribosomal RNA small subunit methyltransferase H n=1 Tax=Amaricoccus solimangrovi TaxID=2589815 RepID=A0A501WXD0_9RHOB|nr:16S rRNA (cytosine(1402)-N(4))-methyltransferase RsmH [Amaricoccus solimangrovi]TPE50536.1 16S rRNA (cytosine(1402)-N(4))-methyltransferase RsmH [Amaricoccus solimangrovi]